jgi:hypothetical protein
MSWSINLSGPKTVVIAELRHAAIELQHALDAAQSVTNDSVTVSVSGSGYEGSDGSCGIGASFYVNGSAPPVPVVVKAVEPVAEQVAEVTKEVPAAETVPEEAVAVADPTSQAPATDGAPVADVTPATDVTGGDTSNCVKVG